MAEVELTQEQATRPELLPPLCVRCNAPATGVVERPVADAPAGGRGAFAGGGSSRGSSPGVLELLAGLALILEGAEHLRTAKGRAARLGWWAVLALGALVCAVGVAELCGRSTGTAGAVVGGVGMVAILVVLIAAPGAASGAHPAGQQLARVPVCDRHRDHWRRYRQVVAVATLGVIAWGVWLAVLLWRAVSSPPGQGDSQGLQFFLGLLAAAAVIGLAAWFVRAPVTAERTAGRGIRFRGVAPAFAKAVAEQPTNGKESGGR